MVPQNTMTVIDEPTRHIHKVIKHEDDPRIVVTRCGKKVARIGGPHPKTPGHFIAFPNCNCLIPVTRCEICFD